MLGIMFGVGAVIAMLSIGAGAEQQSLELIDQLGVRNVVVRSLSFDDAELEEIRKHSPGLSQRDIVAMKEAIPNLEFVAPRSVISPWSIRSAHGKSEAKVYGVSPQHAELSNLRVASGRFFDEYDARTHAQVCVLGAAAKRDLFGAQPALGKRIKVNDLWLEVVGVAVDSSDSKSSFEGVDISTSADVIYLPFPTMLRKFDSKPLDSPLDEIVMRMSPKGSAADTAVIARTLLDRNKEGTDASNSKTCELQSSRHKLVIGFCKLVVALRQGGCKVTSCNPPNE